MEGAVRFSVFHNLLLLVCVNLWVTLALPRVLSHSPLTVSCFCIRSKFVVSVFLVFLSFRSVSFKRCHLNWGTSGWRILCIKVMCLFRSDANLHPCWQGFSILKFFFCLLDVISLTYGPLRYVVWVAFLQKFTAHCTFLVQFLWCHSLLQIRIMVVGDSGFSIKFKCFFLS